MNIDQQQAAFEAWVSEFDTESDEYQDMGADQYFIAGYQAALASPEVEALRDALEQCRFALEPYDDIKPRDWKSDRENLRYAHQAVCAALAAMEKQP